VDRSRLEAFSDGVFAVAITLLALNLTVAGPGHGALWGQLGTRWPAFAAYVISFFTIGIVWVNHHVLVRSITVVTRTLLFLNLLLLLFVVVIPFATGVAAEYLTAKDLTANGGSAWDPRVALALYGAVFLGMSIGFGSIFEWTLHGERVDQPVPVEKRWAARVRFVGGAGVYAIAIAVALFSPVASFVIIALVAVYYIAQRTPGTAGTGDAEPPDDTRSP
jgi:uncharacterized membrane protein